MNSRCRSYLAPLGIVALALGGFARADEPKGLSDAVRKYTKEATPHFEYAVADLNGDGIPDAIVRLIGPDWCGSGGCNMVIFRGGPHGYKLVSTATVTQKPIKLSPEVQHGWHTLLVSVRGGGLLPGFLALMQFNGSRYPGNPSVQPRATPEQAAAATELDFHEAEAR